jgi:hypothetical protein
MGVKLGLSLSRKNSGLRRISGRKEEVTGGAQQFELSIKFY